MNGAAAVPERNTSTPSNSSTTMIGTSQYFLLCLIQPQSSPRKDRSLWALAVFSKSFSVFIVIAGCPGKLSELAEILRRVFDAGFRLPACLVAGGLLFQ